MPLAHLSKRNRIEIPRDFLKQLGLKKGESLRLEIKGGKIVLFPIRDLSDMCGIFEGMDTSILKEVEKY